MVMYRSSYTRRMQILLKSAFLICRNAVMNALILAILHTLDRRNMTNYLRALREKNFSQKRLTGTYLASLRSILPYALPFTYSLNGKLCAYCIQNSERNAELLAVD